VRERARGRRGTGGRKVTEKKEQTVGQPGELAGQQADRSWKGDAGEMDDFKRGESAQEDYQLMSLRSEGKGFKWKYPEMAAGRGKKKASDF